MFCCNYSTDGRFVFTGSEDHNVRIWKSKADEKLGVTSSKENKAKAYREKLIERYSAVGEVRKIKNHHHVPKAILKLSDKKKIMKASKKRKETNVRNHSAPGSVPFVSERAKMVREEQED